MAGDRDWAQQRGGAVNGYPSDSDAEDQISLEKDLALSGEDPDAFYNEEMKTLQRDADIQKLSHRMTLLFILIPCLLAAVFGFAYVDLQNRLSQMKSVGSKQVRELSDDYTGRVTSLALKLEKLEKSLAQKMSILKDSLVATQAGMKKNQKRFKALADTKIDKEDYKKAATANSAALTALKEGMAEQKESVLGLSKKLANELDEEANVITTLQSDLREQGERLAETASLIEMLQKKALNLELDVKALADKTIERGAWKDVRQKDQATMTALQEKLKGLAEEISWLENKLNIKRKSKPTGPVGTAQPKPTPDKDKIIEQDINE